MVRLQYEQTGWLMIIGIGMDIVELDRIAAAIKRDAFVDRVFTVAEQAYCRRRGAQQAASYAARWAGKEAVMKALGTGLAGGGTWHDVEITCNDRGKPEVSLSGFFACLANQLGVTEIHISLTHGRDYAAAQVVLWGRNENENRNSC